MKSLPPVRRWALADCHVDTPQAGTAGAASWLVRTANFVVELTMVDGEAVLSRADSPDEYMVVVSSGLGARMSAGGAQAASDGDALFIVPPGASELRVSGQGLVTRVFSHRANDLAALAGNAADYAERPVDLALATAWPAPADGFRLRHYALPEYVNPANGISRVFRCTTLMLNVMTVYEQPRDPRTLMPHSHADYEQVTVAGSGRFLHHLRTPWSPDFTQWRDDEHLEVGSPSALVIPSRLIHTTQAMEAGCWLIDVFGPPRLDFASKPGFVCNEAAYPLPHPPL